MHTSKDLYLIYLLIEQEFLSTEVGDNIITNLLKYNSVLAKRGILYLISSTIIVNLTHNSL